MSIRYFILPVGIGAVAAIYWWLSRDMAGTTMLAIFALAMGLFGSILLPTVNDVGPTAPVDPDWEPRQPPR
jgi:di/tricarboxylate transporter